MVDWFAKDRSVVSGKLVIIGHTIGERVAMEPQRSQSFSTIEYPFWIPFDGETVFSERNTYSVQLQNVYPLLGDRCERIKEEDE